MSIYIYLYEEHEYYIQNTCMKSMSIINRTLYLYEEYEYYVYAEHYTCMKSMSIIYRTLYSYLYEEYEAHEVVIGIASTGLDYRYQAILCNPPHGFCVIIENKNFFFLCKFFP